MGTNPTFKASNAKVSSAKVFMKSSSFAKAASLAKVSSFTNKSSADKPLFFPKVESSTKLSAKSSFTTKRVGFAKLSKPNKKKAISVLLRQDALEPAIRQLIIVFLFISLSAIPPITIDYILEAREIVKSDIDLNNLDS